MSKVKLIVDTKASLGFGEVKETDISLPENKRIRGIVRWDFEPEADGARRVSDDLCLVVDIDDMNNLVGRLLTITDAVTTDREQRAALKDLVSNAVWGWHNGRMENLGRTWRFDKGYEKEMPTK